MGPKLETCDIYHSIPLDELNTNMQEVRLYSSLRVQLKFTRPIKIPKKKLLLANYQTKLKDNKNVTEQKTFKIIAIHMNLTIKTQGIVHHS